MAADSPSPDVQARAIVENTIKYAQPRCNVCGVDYELDYEGACQQPAPNAEWRGGLPGEGSWSRMCSGSVAIHAEQTTEAIFGALSAGGWVVRHESEELTPDEADYALAQLVDPDSLPEQFRETDHIQMVKSLRAKLRARTDRGEGG